MITRSSICAFAGLDGGATKTKARAIDANGNLIGEGDAGPCSLTLSPKLAAESCRQALLQALAGSGVELASCQLVCGVAGLRQPERRATFEKGLADVGRLEIISDGYAALLGAHRGAPGGVVITGTGSVALSLDEDGTIRQAGGLGPVCGDEGSGNWLGRMAVRSALRAADDAAAGEGEITPLSVALIDLLGSDHEAILDWISRADATRFAELVPLIIRYGARGDGLACQLLNEAVEETCRLVRLIGRRGELPVSWVGGLAAMLEERLPQAVRSRLKSPEGDAMDGALIKAFGLAPPESYG